MVTGTSTTSKQFSALSGPSSAPVVAQRRVTTSPKNCTCGVFTVFCTIWHCAYLSLWHYWKVQHSVDELNLRHLKDVELEELLELVQHGHKTGASTSTICSWSCGTGTAPSICIPPGLAVSPSGGGPLDVSSARTPPVAPPPLPSPLSSCRPGATGGQQCLGTVPSTPTPALARPPTVPPAAAHGARRAAG